MFIQSFLSLCLLTACLAQPSKITFPKEGMALLPSTKANKPSDILIRLELVKDKNITLMMSGPADKWFALGFGQSMYLTEAVIFSTGKSGKDKPMARQYRLSDESSDGVQLNPAQLWYTVSQTKRNGRINVTVTRPLFADASDIEEFDLGESMINVIWARGPGMKLVEHEQKQRPIHLNMTSGIATIGSHPIRKRKRKRAHHYGKPRDMPSMLSYPSAGMAELISTNPKNLSQIFIRLVFDATSNNATMILSAPVGKWFAVGFGQSMYLTEAVIFSKGKSGMDDAMARTYHLSDESSDGVQLNPKQVWNTIYQGQNNGMQIVTLVRPLFVDAQNITEFDMGERLVNVIWARGKTLKLVEHEQKQRLVHLAMTPVR